MAEAERETVNRQVFQVAYDGASAATGVPAKHSMDVQSLGPALIAFGRLIREANAQINGRKSTVKVLVESDFEHKCFNITFDVVQSVLHHVAAFLTGDDVKNAKEILEDLGIILGAPGLGLFGYLKWKNQEPITEVKDSDEKGIVIVQLGNGNIANVSRAALEFSKNPKIRTALENTLKPLGIDGIETIKFQGDAAPTSYDKDDAIAIVSAFDIAPESAIVPDPEEEEGIIAWLRTYGPVYDAKVAKWKFLHDGKVISVDVSNTSIVADVIHRGGALVNDLYKVRMSVHSHMTPSGQEHFDYKIIEVIGFTPAKPQLSLPFGDQGS